MKIIFMVPRKPGFFARAIAWATNGKWSHCGILTGLVDPQGEEIVVEASYDCGVRPTFLGAMSKHPHEVWEVPCNFDWTIYKMEFHGKSYGYGQIIGMGLQKLWGGKVPIRGGQVCSEFIVRMLQRGSNLLMEHNPNEIDPHELWLLMPQIGTLVSKSE